MRPPFTAYVAEMPAPGTFGGPCSATCTEHVECRRSRSMAREACRDCGQPIGYETPFKMADRRMVHTACLAVEAVAS